MSHLPLVFLDFEGTGLPIDLKDGTTDWPLPLELGVVVTDGDLNVVVQDSWVIRWPRWKVLERMQPEALAMHEANGLLEEIEQAPLVLEGVEHACLSLLVKHKAEGLYMAGSGLTYDRRMLARWFPILSTKFHHRNVDLTTLRYFFGSEKSEPAHRALPDCHQSLGMLREYVARARACGLLPLAVAV